MCAPQYKHNVDNSWKRRFFLSIKIIATIILIAAITITVVIIREAIR